VKPRIPIACLPLKHCHDCQVRLTSQEFACVGSFDLAQYPENPKSVKTTHLNEPIRHLISRISKEWPPIHMQDSILEGSYRLASPHSFAELLKHNLGPAIHIQMNAKPINSALLVKLDLLQVALKDEV
jgi:hypothetical protein